jgi:ribonuclease D
MPSSTATQLIDTAETLTAFCADLVTCPWLAIDTEFLREKTYYPQFCLMQIASAEVAACIDPIKLRSLAPLEKLLFDDRIIKVFHAGRQDLEILYHLFERIPQPIFDTQLAAPLLGFPEQIGYAGLIQELLGITLAKSHSRTDWSRRPLSPEQLHYASDDVTYLAAAYPKMVERLKRLNRLDWLKSDCEDLTDPALYRNPPELAWQRIGGAHLLKGFALAVLQDLAAWRENAARTENLPRGWIVKDEVLLDIARQQPRSHTALSLVRGLDEKTLRRHGNAICNVIAKAFDAPHRDMTAAPPPPGKRTVEQEALIDVLSGIVRLRAAANTLNPAIIANRKDLAKLLDGDPDTKLLQGWRRQMVGHELEALAQGRAALTVRDGQLEIDRREPHHSFATN